jgi:G3E family GTPase
MAKVDIFSGFLGAGKTTLIKKLIAEGYDTKNIVLIENEFGEIGVDTGFLRESGVKINEMVAGCICCTLVGDFGKALNEVIEQYDPDRILIEPSGVGKLSDVIIAVQDLQNDKIELNGFTTVVDAKRYKMYMENFGEFFANQVEHASSIFLSHQQSMTSAELDEVVKDIRTLNKNAQIVTTDWDQLSGAKMLEVMESDKTLNAELDKLREEAYEELEAHEHEHEHDHDHDHDHEHHHHHHHHGEGEHDADEVFGTIGLETAQRYEQEEIRSILEKLSDEEEYGKVLRAKGILQNAAGSWFQFDYVPGEIDMRDGSADYTGRLCVIGADLNEKALTELFHL